MTSLIIKTVRTTAEFDQLEPTWLTLSEADSDATVFNAWDWNRVWWEHYAHLGALHVFVFYDQSRIVAIAPFYSGQSRLLSIKSVENLYFIGTGGDTSPDDLNMLCLPDWREEVSMVLTKLILEQNMPERLVLRDMPAGSTLFSTLRAHFEKTSRFFISPEQQTRHCHNLPATYADYLSQLSRNSRKRIKHRENRLRAEDSAIVRLCHTDEEVEQAMDALIRLHKARWLSKGGQGAFGSKSYNSFHRALMHCLHKQKQLWLMVLEVDEKIIAVEYAFAFKGVLSFFQTGFDPNYEHLSPGHILMTHAIKRAIEQGFTQIDLLKGDYAYKTSYAKQTKQTATLDYIRPAHWRWLKWLLKRS